MAVEASALRELVDGLASAVPLDQLPHDFIGAVLATEEGRRALASELALHPSGEGALAHAMRLELPPDLDQRLHEVELLRQAAVSRQGLLLHALSETDSAVVASILNDGTIGWCNAVATEATGLRAGDSIVAFAAQTDPAELARVQQELAEGKPSVRWTIELETARGPAAFDFTMTPDRTDGVTEGFALIGYDITALRAAERGQEESQAFLTTVLDTSADAVIVSDADAEVVYINEQARALTEADRSDLPWNIAAVDGLPHTDENDPLRKAIRTGETQRNLLTFELDGERSLWATATEPMHFGEGVLGGAVAVLRDVTDEHFAAVAESERRAFLASVLQSTSDAIVAVDQHLNIRFLNDEAKDVFGYVGEGRSVLDSPSDILSVNGEPPTPENLPLERALRGEQDVKVELRMAGTGERTVLVGISNPIHGADGTVVGAVGVYRDITADREAEAAEARRRQFILQMLDTSSDPVVALNLLTDEEYLNMAAKELGFPDPESDLPLPFTTLDGSPLPPDLLFLAMAGEPQANIEMVHEETGRVLMASTFAIESDDGVLGAVMSAKDITDLRGALQQLEIQSAAMESTITAMFITDVEGTIEWVNRAFTKLTGFSAAEAIGQNPRILKSGKQAQSHYEELWSTILARKPWNGQVINRRKDGSLYMVEQWVTPIIDDTGKVTHFVAVHDDITARVEAEERILHMATHDALTELPNRRLFLEHLDMAMARADRADHSLAVLMMDLDKFKDVNDTLGHQAGDELLRDVSRRLLARVRHADVVARFGGDEFAVIVDGTDQEGAEQVASDIIWSLGQRFEILGHDVRTGTSIGLAMYEEGLSPEQLLDQADLALYAAKDRQRGTMAVYEPSMGIATKERVRLANDLREAIRSEELRLAYQPVFDLKTGTMTSLESLVRWERSDGTCLYPADFLAAASEQGILPNLGRWVLDAVCAQAAAWLAADAGAPPIAINVSPEELRNRHWGNSLVRALERWSLPPSALNIEVTEEGIYRAAEENLHALRDLKKQGLHLTLDDFGSGFSSLLHFKRLPVNRIKLARVFVADLLTEIASGAIVRASALLAHSIRAKLVAKGVEDYDQLLEVHRLGCQEVQGFIVEGPISAEEAAEHFGHPHKAFERSV